MPRKSSSPSVADELAAPGGAAAVDRAISLLAAYRAGDKALSVTELAERTRLYKSTVLRLLASLAHGRLVQKTSDGQWALGAEVARLAGIYSASFSLEDVLMPEMRALVARTQESVAFHVRQGDQRLVLLRVDSPQLLRDHVRAGDLLPMNRGAGGRVLMAYAGAKGRIYDQVRKDGYVMLSSDRIPGLVGISAPVCNGGGQVVGALTLTAPDQRVRPHFVEELRASASRLSEALGATETSSPPKTRG
ncbi:IclR family transcriptional regulator [Hydrogenophaga sp.]|uniref:IclR family transcriptional regulator n=1 Tax=Hydrogenophaga sp. TaxID=1904254 RepID=UPI0008CDAE32|nr:IclR family transcriptional regulator [Hydrogenophaga sp.]OGA75671.1 MAG: IclR family transcriptional regulator [Burkholderiales bacterium GWE1_65_30]OGA93781.1 MAG: IclR family transcriptional regulator [Burkholderiales bacterium GWF1_66_17]MDP3886651.1 IclR family transcriptional regulator [Hydrogenophaga sp.]HAX20188.1 IclR family transcriptional regulator [Hydrogenophaga sp.]HBU18530.1 IclR family transcriptional regulator [Hydrogenophaga sp.]